MPIQDLLAQVAEEHRLLQCKYDEALIEMRALHVQSATLQAPELAIRSFAEDTEAASSQRYLLSEFLHSAAPPAVPRASARSSAVRSSAQHRSSQLSSFSLSSERRPVVLPTRSYLAVGGRTTKDSVDFADDKRREAVAKLLKRPILESVLIVVVITNIVVLWADTDRRASKSPRTAWSEVLNLVFTVFYTVEFGLRVFAYRWQVFNDRWNTLDFVVVVVDIVSIMLEAIVGDVFLGINASIFRLLRVFRLLRLFKVLRFVIELQLLVHGFFGAMKAQLYAGLMLEVVVLLWSFLFVEVVHPHVVDMTEAGFFQGCARCPKAYSSMFEAHLTIWQQVIAGDGWGAVTMDVINRHPETTFIFIGCLMTIQFAMLNLIFTVIVDAAGRARQEDDQQRLAEKEMAFAVMKDKSIQLCQNLDTDGSGELSLDELIDGYAHNQDFADTMATLDITSEDLETLFLIMDEDRSGTVSYVEFVNNLYKMKEYDQHTLLMFVKGYVCDLRYIMQGILMNMVNEIHVMMSENSNQVRTMMGHMKTLLVEDCNKEDQQTEKGKVAEADEAKKKECQASDNELEEEQVAKQVLTKENKEQATGKVIQEVKHESKDDMNMAEQPPEHDCKHKNESTTPKDNPLPHRGRDLPSSDPTKDDKQEKDDPLPHPGKDAPSLDPTKDDKLPSAHPAGSEKSTIDQDLDSIEKVLREDSITFGLAAVLSMLDSIRKDLNANFDRLQPSVQDVMKVSSEIANTLRTNDAVRSSIDPVLLAVPEKSESRRVSARRAELAWGTSAIHCCTAPPPPQLRSIPPA